MPCVCDQYSYIIENVMLKQTCNICKADACSSSWKSRVKKLLPNCCEIPQNIGNVINISPVESEM